VRALFLAALLAVASCGRDNLNPPIRPNPPILGNEIVFTSNRGADGLMDLYASNADGTGFHRLTSDSSYDGESRWSPDGTKIAFVHGNGDSLNVFVMNADGTNRTRLTNRYEVRGPCWSPDGSQIAYQSGHSYGQGNPNQLWVMDADGTAPHVVIDYDSLNGANQISWTPRNTFLGVDGFNLLEFDADGKNKRQIMPLRLYSFEVFPRMSPDGTKIVFAWTGPYGPGGYPSNIYIANVDGTGLKQLTDELNGATRPAWSSDGSKIAYTQSSATIWIMNADGSDQHEVPLPNNLWAWPFDLMGDWK